MKNYKVTVNGNTYEVAVEEVGGQAEAIAVQSVQAAATAPVAVSAAAGVAAPAAAPASQAASSAGGEDVMAPLPGTVISINVKEGEKVKANQILLIFEAMKMENELVAPRDGTVQKIHVAKGELLESGKPVITIV